MPIAELELEYDAKEAEHLENRCFLCGRSPAEFTEFRCDSCGDIFWRGYLCERALTALSRNPVYFLKRHFSHVHLDCRRSK